MKTNEDQEAVFKTDDMYLPIQYKGIKVDQPGYKGDGMHSVAELQEICNQFQEYCHQQNVIKYNCFDAIVELRRELGKS